MAPNAVPSLLSTERLHVVQLPPDAAWRALAYHEANQAHVAAVSPTRPANFFSVTYWRTRLAQDREDFRRDLSLRVFLLPRDQPFGLAPIVGNVSITHIRRGPLQSADLGYGLDHRYEGQGLMTEALRALCGYAFTVMGLHRLQATHLPENVRSAAVLKRLGFHVEGIARELLLIDGQWRDHVVNALLAPRDGPGPAAGPPHED